MGKTFENMSLTNMNQSENYFFQSFKGLFTETVDPVLLIIGQHALRFDESERDELLSSEDIWNDLMIRIPRKCNLQSFLCVLFKAGYQDIALKINHMSRKASSLSLPVKKISSIRRAQELYMKLKIRNHNNPIDPHSLCKTETNNYRKRLLTEKNVWDKKTEADMHAFALSAEISSLVMKYDKRIDVEKLFDELKAINSTHTHIVEILYHSHRVLVCAICGKLSDAEEEIHAAMESSIFIALSIELMNSQYIRFFVMFAKFGESPSRKLQKTILEIAADILCIVEDEPDEEFRVFWELMTFQRCIFCLLGLNFKGQPIQGFEPTKRDIDKAKHYMAEVFKRRTKMNYRRIISDNIAKARIAELENDNYAALILYRRAVDNGGTHYGEIACVKEYLQTLDRASQNSNTLVKTVHETHNRESTNPRPIYNQQQHNQVPRLVHSENANDGEAIREFYEGNSNEIINLHGQKTSPKLIY